MDPKSKNATIIIVIAIAILLIGYLWYITVPRKVPESTKVAVPADLLDNEQAQQILKKPVFGTVPVAVNPQEVSRPDPFANI